MVMGGLLHAHQYQFDRGGAQWALLINPSITQPHFHNKRSQNHIMIFFCHIQTNIMYHQHHHHHNYPGWARPDVNVWLYGRIIHNFIPCPAGRHYPNDDEEDKQKNSQYVQVSNQSNIPMFCVKNWFPCTWVCKFITLFFDQKSQNNFMSPPKNFDAIFCIDGVVWSLLRPSEPLKPHK